MAHVFSPFQNLNMKRAIESILPTARIELHVPQYVPCPADGCGYDDVLGTAIDQNCLICQGKGRIRNEAVAVLMVRVAWLDHRQHGVYMNMPIGETADVELQARLDDLYLFDKVRSVEGAYILVDGKRLTIKSLTPNRVQGLTSLDVRCAITNQDVLGV